MTNPSAAPSPDPTSTPTRVRPSGLPAVVRGFLEAHAVRDVDAAARAFTADAVVTDQGRTFRGTDEVGRFLRESGAEFTYTTELVGAERTGPEEWVAVHHLEGDFPGGAADLGYRFTTRGDHISGLRIGV